MALTKVAPAGIGSTPGDGYRIGSSFLHSTGVEITNINAIGILTAASLDISGAIDFDGHTELDNVNIAGVVTATTFVGNGANLTSLNGSNISSGTVAAARIDNLSGAKITSGTVATARLGSGTANNSSFLRGDQTWAVVSTGPGTGEQYVIIDQNGTNSNSGTNVYAGYRSGQGLASGGTNENTFYGTDSGKATTTAGYNTYIGHRAGENSTVGSNVAVGAEALRNNTSSSGCNTAVGVLALTTNNSGRYNTAVGHYALKNASSGSRNTTVGVEAGIKITTASNNNAFGYKTLTGDGGSHNVTGESNVVMGNMAGYGLSSGEKNVLIGHEAGYDMTTGNWNSGLGFQVLENVGVGTCNTACGYEAGYTIQSGNNNTCLGFQATATSASTSNEVTIGNSAVTKFRIPGLNFTIDGSTWIGSSTQYGNSAFNISNGGTVITSSGQNTLKLIDSTAQTTNVGARILLGGNYRSSGDASPMVELKSFKENSTDNNYAYGFKISTTPNGGSLSERMTITSVGRVGINDTSPDSMLHVRNDNSYAAKFGGHGGGSEYYMEIGQLATNGSAGLNATGTSGGMLFKIRGSEKARIASAGHFEIGTNGSYGSSPGMLCVGRRNADPGAVTLSIARGEAIGGGTGPVLEFVHGPDGGTQRRHEIYSYVGDLRIFADSNENIEFRGTNTIFKASGGSEYARIDSNGHFIPGTNDTHDLGSSSKRWRDIYTGDLNLSNEGSTNDVDGTWGNYTIQEGENDLFLINNRSGKKYKFNLTEVS